MCRNSEIAQSTSNETPDLKPAALPKYVSLLFKVTIYPHIQPHSKPRRDLAPVSIGSRAQTLELGVLPGILRSFRVYALSGLGFRVFKAPVVQCIGSLIYRVKELGFFSL